MLRLLSLLALLALVLSACMGEVGSTNPNTSSEPPTPASDQVGTVAGRIMRKPANGGPVPFDQAIVYLGTILKSETGAEGLVELDRDNAPKAVADPQGRFAFTNVAPGRYGLMLDTPRGAILLNNPQDGKNLIIEVTGGKLLNLGELTYAIDFNG